MALLAPHLTPDERLRRMPAKRRVQIVALAWLADRIGPTGKTWPEREVTDRIRAQIAFDDPVRLRRDLVDAGFLVRRAGGVDYRRADTGVDHDR